ncbi:uncharacterized protein [Euwallacea fornicatus]|uniref:uncharacterized protein isoform X1 n=1 Tax=Euwallacea fornicatus TaxID=995702 RepID=UPI00338F519F
MESHRVELYIYDLSMGLAAQWSSVLTGTTIAGIWHTSIMVYGREYFFGSHGIESCNPGKTALGAPKETKYLGETQVPYSVFIDYIAGLAHSTFSAKSYDLFEHNCNNFSEEIAHFLCDRSIPQYILDLPNEVLNLNLGVAIKALVEQLESSARPIEEEQQRFSRENSPDLSREIEETRYNNFLAEQRRKTLKEKLAKRERKRDRKRKKILASGGIVPEELEEVTMADTESSLNGTTDASPSDQVLAMEEEERKAEEEKKKSRDPPVVYKDFVDVKEEFDSLLGLIDGKLTAEEKKSTEELQQYMMGDEGSWALGEGFLEFISRLLNDKQFSVEVRVKILNILAVAGLKDDIILLLHSDRKDHVLMNYAYDIDRLSKEEQEALSLFVANLFESLSSSEWLLYISEWPFNNQQISNIRVTTKVAVHCLLSDNPQLQDRGSAIIYNLASKEVKTVVFDDLAVEITMAILQFFNQKPSEEQLFRCMKALARFTEVSRQEVPQLIQMIGPDPSTFKGTSERIDVFIEKISPKIR